MKKTISLVLVLCLALCLTAGPAYAASSSLSSAQQTVQALGIITGDENGNLNLSGNVTRAQYAKMMIMASKYKDSISSTAKSSPFKDVRYTHWAASYVQAAVSAGWITGYTDGTFRPDNYVKLEEAVSAVLKMLGFTSPSDFTGSFPEAQIAKYNALGMNENISKTQGQVLSRQDCMNLFYNLLSTKNKSDSYYATTLNYKVNSSGEVDYSSLVLANMKGPFIVEDSAWSSTLPFSSSTATVYKNGSASTLSAISTYDVYYYNTGMKTIWVYRSRVSGVYTAASPSTSAPASVTVAGKTYTIATSSAAYALSDMGTYGIGDSVTLLLGMNGDIVGVVQSSSLDTTKYGLVTSTGSKTYSSTSGGTYSSDTVTVACTDGITYEYEYSSSGFSKGNMVKVSFSNGKASIGLLSESNLSGIVNSAGTAIGSYTFADDVQILDSTGNGSFLRVYPLRLAGIALDSRDVRFYALDLTGKISDMILNNVTGDMYKYGILTKADESTGSMSVSSSYQYLVDGVSGSFSSSYSAFSVSTGPVQIEFSGSNIISMKNLTGISLSALNSAFATSDITQYALGDNVAVYICENGNYKLSSISAVSSGSYTLKGYYDRLQGTGGRIRVIVAYAS